MTLEELGIENDMPKGWVRGKNQPTWHLSLYKRWVHMWERCRNPEHKDYSNYKDCKIDERYRLFSNYIDDISKLENFDKLCENPSKWSIDKDKIDPNNRYYFFEHLTIISGSANIKERNARRGNPSPMKPILGISLEDNSFIIFKSIRQAKEKGFDPGTIAKCLKGRAKSHHNYKWSYLFKDDNI